jgi:hypothetical protein
MSARNHEGGTVCLHCYLHTPNPMVSWDALNTLGKGLTCPVRKTPDPTRRTLTVRATGPEGVLLTGDRAAEYEVGTLEHQDVVVLTVAEYRRLRDLADER